MTNRCRRFTRAPRRASEASSDHRSWSCCSPCSGLFSTASAVAAHWQCLGACGMAKMMATIQHVAEARGHEMVGDMAMPMCPTPTATIQISLSSGFAAAVVCGLTTGLAKHASSGKDMPPAHGAVAAEGGGRPADEGSVEEINTRGGFHPTLTLALALRGRIAWRRAMLYVTAQIAGAVLATALLVGIVGPQCHELVLLIGLNAELDDAMSVVLLQAFLNVLLYTPLHTRAARTHTRPAHASRPRLIRSRPHAAVPPLPPQGAHLPVVGPAQPPDGLPDPRGLCLRLRLPRGPAAHRAGRAQPHARRCARVPASPPSRYHPLPYAPRRSMPIPRARVS